MSGHSVSSWCAFLICAAILFFPLLRSAEGQVLQTTHEARVQVELRVSTIAQIDFPEGTNFLLRIPSREEALARRGPYALGNPPYLDVAEIPFVVNGNAWLTVSAEPGSVQASRPKRGFGPAYDSGPVGLAFPDDRNGPNKGIELPYRLWIDFSPTGVGGRSADLLGPARGASVAHINAADGPILGVVYVVPNLTWGEIASRRFSHPGYYRGEVRIAITTFEK